MELMMILNRFENNGYRNQGAATSKFGVNFRSRLEAEWAYWLDLQKCDWTYSDHECFDFVIEGTKVEIKPLSIHLISEAIRRSVKVKETILVVAGNPETYLKIWIDGSGLFSVRTPRSYRTSNQINEKRSKESLLEMLTPIEFDSRFECFYECQDSHLPTDYDLSYFFADGHSRRCDWRMSFGCKKSDSMPYLISLRGVDELHNSYGLQCNGAFLTECSHCDPSIDSLSSMWFAIQEHEGLHLELLDGLQIREKHRSK